MHENRTTTIFLKQSNWSTKIASHSLSQFKQFNIEITFQSHEFPISIQFLFFSWKFIIFIQKYSRRLLPNALISFAFFSLKNNGTSLDFYATVVKNEFWIMFIFFFHMNWHHINWFDISYGHILYTHPPVIICKQQ